MRYISTRGQAPALSFEDTLLDGLARDGGLYVPDAWPRFTADDFRALRGKPYAEVAFHVMRPFVGGDLTDDELGRVICDAYAAFDHQQVAPLVQLSSNHFVMELFHGPTLAFKDVAMQVLGRLYDHVLAKRDRRITIVGATSGDTGSAAIEAVRGRQRAEIFIMHPHGRTSEVQRRQMTTVDAPNVHNIAIEGTFDDCQNLLKAMFNDQAFRDEIALSGVNSINWARVMPQAVYYVTAALTLGGPDRPVSFAVPTGNFGDIFAGYVAMQMGLPIDRLVIATNINDILTRVMDSGDHTLGRVEPTMSPSMDIQVSSNFERLLFDLHDRDPAKVRGLMDQLKQAGGFRLEGAALDRARETFAAQRVDESQTLDTIRRVHHECGGYLVDPHTAVGVEAARREADPAVPMITLATAHPAKFPDAVEQAAGVRPPLPERMADLYDRPERCEVLPNDFDAVTAHIRSRRTG